MNIWNWLALHLNSDFQIIKVISVWNFSTIQVILNMQSS